MGISAKKQKTIKKTVHGYCLAFGFRPPYQVIVNGEFCRAALEKQVYVRHALPDLLGGLTRIVTTDCILKDIKSKGHDFTNALVLAQKFDLRKCVIKKKKSQCQHNNVFKILVSTNNPEHFFVASGDVQLKNAIRKIPGVPVVIVNTRKKGLGLEDMTARSKAAMKTNEVNKVTPLDKETARLKRALLGEEKVEERPKKRKVKGVNPLAMKKKKKTTN
ncbi:unnamed protein product [Rhizopus stolonifer]